MVDWLRWYVHVWAYWRFINTFVSGWILLFALEWNDFVALLIRYTHSSLSHLLTCTHTYACHRRRRRRPWHKTVLFKRSNKKKDASTLFYFLTSSFTDQHILILKLNFEFLKGAGLQLNLCYTAILYSDVIISIQLLIGATVIVVVGGVVAVAAAAAAVLYEIIHLFFITLSIFVRVNRS